MNFKAGIFLTVFALACFAPAVAPAMGERPPSHPMCDMSGKTKVFVLSSDNREVKETFKVPVRYMSMEFERNGKVNSTLNLSAQLENLEPRCKEDGKSIFPKEDALEITLRPNLSSEDKWVELVKMTYTDSDKIQFEEIEMSDYPDFTFKVSKDRPKEIKGPVRPGGYIPTFPNKSLNISNYFHIACEAIGIDIRFFNMCRMSFLYQPNISVVASFHSSRLPEVEKVYFSSIELIKKFHTE